MRIRTAVLALALIVAACGLGPGPTQTEGSSPAPLATEIGPTVAPGPTGAPASTGPPAAPATGPGTFDLTLGASNGEPFPIQVVDKTGLVLSVDSVSPLQPVGDASAPPFPLQGASNQDGDELILVYGWLGGACDRSTTIVFERDGAGFRLYGTSDVAPGTCIMIGLLRAIELRLAAPVPAASVTVGQQP